jgi:hypothetical protein
MRRSFEPVAEPTGLPNGGPHAEGVVLREGKSLKIVVDDRFPDAIDLLQAQCQQQ